jgi:hypothetical protein
VSVGFFEGGLMLGTDQGHIVDATRTDFLTHIQDFVRLNPVTMQAPAGEARAKVDAHFNDDRADSARKLSVDVKLEVFDFSNHGIREVLLSKYTIKNTGAQKLQNLRCSVFMDFGGYPSYYYGSVGYDSTRHFGYVSEGVYPLVGTFVIDSLPVNDPTRSTFWAIDNISGHAGQPWGTTDGFTYAKKWQAMSTRYGHRTIPNGVFANVSYVITAPVMNINPGDSAIAVFGHSASTSLTALNSLVDKGINYWRNPPKVPVDHLTELPGELRMNQNYPNPVSLAENANALVRFALPRDDEARIEVYNVLGQPVFSTGTTQMNAGEHLVTIPLNGFRAGMYLCVLRTTMGSLQKKMIITE